MQVKSSCTYHQIPFLKIVDFTQDQFVHFADRISEIASLWPFLNKLFTQMLSKNWFIGTIPHEPKKVPNPFNRI